MNHNVRNDFGKDLPVNDLHFSPFVKAENIIMIELDMPNRTTRDYEGPAVAPKVQAALDAALQDEEDLTLDAE